MDVTEGQTVVDASGHAISARIGHRLREERLRRNICLDGLAATIGVAPSTISLWERGKRRLTVDQLYALANALGMEPAQVVEGE